jgi:hypothetical protein
MLTAMQEISELVSCQSSIGEEALSHISASDKAT